MTKKETNKKHKAQSFIVQLFTTIDNTTGKIKLKCGTWFALIFIAINAAVLILLESISTWELKYIFAKSLLVTFFLPAMVWGAKDTIQKIMKKEKNSNKVNNLARTYARKAGSVLAAILFVLLNGFLIYMFVLAVIDVSSEPQYIQGIVERIEHNSKTPDDIYLQGDRRRYDLYRFGIEPVKGRAYLFRFLPASKTCIALEELSNQRK